MSYDWTSKLKASPNSPVDTMGSKIIEDEGAGSAADISTMKGDPLRSNKTETLELDSIAFTEIM